MDPKYYKQTNKCYIFVFLADWAVRTVLNISAIFLTYATFEVFFFIFSWQNKYKIRDSALFKGQSISE